MAKSILDQLQEHLPLEEVVLRGVSYVSSKYGLRDRAISGQDVVQDVLACFKTRPPIRDPKKVYAYYLRSLEQRALWYLERVVRDPSREKELVDQCLPGSEPEGVDVALREESLRTARLEVDRLFELATADEAQVLRMLLTGQSVAEIASALGVSDSAVRMRLYFLRKRAKRVGGKAARNGRPHEGGPLYFLVSMNDGPILIVAAA